MANEVEVKAPQAAEAAFGAARRAAWRHAAWAHSRRCGTGPPPDW